MTRTSIRVLLFLALALGAVAPGLAQRLPGIDAASEPAPKLDPARAAAETVEALQAKRNAAQAELERYQASAVPRGVAEADAIERRALLESIVRAYDRLLDARDDLAAVERRRAELEQKLAGDTGLPPAPVSPDFADELREAAQAAAQKADAGEAKLALFRQQFDVWGERLRDAEAKLRLAEEQAGAAGDDEGQRVWERDLAAVRVRSHGAVLAGLDALIGIARTKLGEARLELEYATRRFREAAKSVRFTRADLDRTLARLDAEKAALEREFRDAQSLNAARRAALRKAEVERDAARAKPSPRATAADAMARQARLERTVALRRLQAENANLAYDAARWFPEATEISRATWHLRYALLNDRDEAKVRAAYGRVQELLQRVQPWKAFAQRERELALGQVREQEARFAAAAADEVAALREAAGAYRERVALYERVLRSITREEAALERSEADFEEAIRTRPVWTRVYGAWYAARAIARTAWDFELFAAEDTVEVDGRKLTATRSVTVGKSVGAIVVLVLGYLLVSWLVRRLERQLVARFRADPNVARIVRRWLQFVLVAVLFVLALDLVKIPLTVFAFLGGALAIAFGFGAQNLLKNLMSGVMLLIERPLKIGDLVQIGETVGTVTNISIRSSTIRTSDGIETLVPNSALVESNVTNWTHSSSEVRRSVKVAVAYGSDTRKVADTLLAQAERHGQVLENPPPRAIFEDFGADGLAFALEYWIDYAKGVDGRQIASDLRFMIEKALAEAGITVPFPQRALHLDAARPVQVEVVSRAEPQLLPRQSRG